MELVQIDIISPQSSEALVCGQHQILKPEVPGRGLSCKKNGLPPTLYGFPDNLLGSIRLSCIYQASTQRNPSPERLGTSFVVPCPESNLR